MTVEVFPRADGSTHVCAFSGAAPLPLDPADVAPEPNVIERLRSICERLSPAFSQDRIIAKQACFRPITRDFVPLIGRVPRIEGAYVVDVPELVREQRDDLAIAESGAPNFDVNPWSGILAPAGMDLRIVRKINADLAELLKTPDMHSFFKTQGAETFVITPEEFYRLLVSDIAKWARVVKASGARLDCLPYA